MYQISINMSLGKTAHIKMITAKLTCSITELHCVVSGHSLYTCKCNTAFKEIFTRPKLTIAYLHPTNMEHVKIKGRVND